MEEREGDANKVCAELEIIKSSYTLFSVLVIGYSNFSVWNVKVPFGLHHDSVFLL